MNEITVASNEEYIKAQKLHGDIIAYGENCAAALVGLCKSLKLMRDAKLYIALGRESFEDYCTEMVGIKTRMAYNYISAYEHYGESVLQSNAKLGITKLSLIATMPMEKQQEILNDGTVDGMSVAEIKELVKKSKNQGEQLTLFAEEKDKAEKIIGDLEKEIAEMKYNYDKELNGLQKQLEVQKHSVKPMPAVDEAKLRAQIKKELTADNKSKIEKAVKDSIAKEREKIAKEAHEKATAEAKAEADKVIAELNAANKRSEELQKQLSLSDSKQTTVNIYFKALKDDFVKLLEAVDDLSEDAQQKYKKALTDAFDQFKAAVK